MEFGPVRVEQGRRQRSPPVRRRASIARRMTGGKQHSQDVRFPKSPHFGSPMYRTVAADMAPAATAAQQVKSAEVDRL